MTATYQDGSASTTLSITIDDRPPAISYLQEGAPQKSFTSPAHSPIPILAPASAGGAVACWPGSPSGLGHGTGVVAGSNILTAYGSQVIALPY